MATSAMTLSEYAEQLSDLADNWEGDQPVVLIGDLTGSINITEKDGHVKHGSVGYADELFDGNGVMEMRSSDTRFYGTILLPASELSEESAEKIVGDE